MRFEPFLYCLAAAVAAAGLACRAVQWFRITVGPSDPASGAFRRFAAAISALFRLLRVRKASLRPAARLLFQTHILKRSTLRWGMHQAILWGMLCLVLFHALDDWTGPAFFGDYEPTLGPFRFLRNLFGLTLLAGIAIALARRGTVRGLRRLSGWQDAWPLILLAAIPASGFLLEAIGMTSAARFGEMADAHLISPSSEEIHALRACWSRDHGVVFPRAEALAPIPPEVLEAGREISAESCAFCHGPSDAAIVSFPLARALSPAARLLDLTRAGQAVRLFHVVLAALALALLPFGKLRHIVAAPICLMTARAEPQPGPPTSTAARTEAAHTRRALGLDACTHCGACSQHCSVAPVYAVLGVAEILPSEKLETLRAWAGGKISAPADLAAFSLGSFACTECLRCTRLCPCGIDLQDLWIAAKAALTRAGRGDIRQRMAALTPVQWEAYFRHHPPRPGDLPRHPRLSDQAETFWACVQCTTCTSVCPVVAASECPEADLDLTPQQIMNLMRLRLKYLALGSRMLWRCVTCYQCQEHCPQGVRVTDVLCELRNIAASRLARDPQAGRSSPPCGGR